VGHIGGSVKESAIGVVNKNKSVIGSFVHCWLRCRGDRKGFAFQFEHLNVDTPKTKTGLLIKRC
jgi:hypothetical protein